LERFISDMGGRIIAGLLLVGMIPMLLLTALLIPSTGGAPAIVCHQIPNRDGDLTRRLRFRTAGRGTSSFRTLGKFLRKYSIHEIPALWSVVCGNISLKEIIANRS